LKKEINPSDKESSRNLGISHNLAAALEEASAEDSAIFNRPPVKVPKDLSLEEITFEVEEGKLE
jgi:hypothetical protein